MALDPFNPMQCSSSKLWLAWDEVTVECLPSELHSPDAHLGVVVSLAIAYQPIDSQMLTSHLHLTVNPSAIDSNMAGNYSGLKKLGIFTGAEQSSSKVAVTNP
jgi:hypothetical protein